jgi:3-methyladenine DNA glycosylase AlkC
MSGGGAGGKGAAAPVPLASRKLVQSLKEIVNRPEAEIYAALRECGMDPNEAVSRLLSQGSRPSRRLPPPHRFIACLAVPSPVIA